MYRCPCCHQECDESSLVNTKNQIQNYFECAPGLAGYLFEFDQSKALKYFTGFINNRWACDKCIENGLAILGEISEQLFCLWQPHLAYMDQEKVCRTCSIGFTFTKLEQRHWYENLKFWVVSYAVNCKSCRKYYRERKERISEAQKEIERLKVSIDMNNPEQVSLMVSLYEATESHKMAARYKEKLKKLVT